MLTKSASNYIKIEGHPFPPQQHSHFATTNTCFTIGWGQIYTEGKHWREREHQNSHLELNQIQHQLLQPHLPTLLESLHDL